MKMKIEKIIFIVTVSLILSCCAKVTKPNRGDPAMVNIQSSLNEGIYGDTRIDVKDKKNNTEALENYILSEKDNPNQSNAKNDDKFDVSVKDVPARSFFLGLVKGTSDNMVVSPEVKGNITLSLKNVTLLEVLEAVHDTFGYQFQRTDYGYRILPAGLQTHVFKIDYLNLVRSGVSKTLVNSGQFSNKKDSADSQTSATQSSSQESSTSSSNSTDDGSDDQQGLSSEVNTTTKHDFWAVLKSTVQMIIPEGDGRKVVVNPEAGLLLVRAFPAEMSQLSTYLEDLKKATRRQVVIEAKILEVALKDGYQAGLDWTLLGGLTQSGTGTIGDEQTTDLEEIANNIFTVEYNRFSTVIKLLSTQGNIQTLSSPRISTLNNQKALIKVGTDQYFITNVSNTTNSNTTTTSTDTQTQDITLTPFFSGIALDVTPEISDDGSVLMHIHPVVSKVTDQERKFTVSGKEQELPLAKSELRESDSIVSAKSGQIIVIGGLMEDKTEQNSASTPFLGKIPFFGSLFRRLDQSSDKTELVILLKPVVIADNAWVKDLKDIKQRYKKLNRGFYYGPHSKIFGNMAEMH